MDHLNLFNPYEAQPGHHENSLTRAFLIVLRAVPVAHQAWLELVDAAHRKASGRGVPGLHELPAPRLCTQVGAPPERVSRLVSVLLTDEHYFTPKDVGRSTRTQILDGVVSYDRELALVIENKPCASDVWDEQLSINLRAWSKEDQVNFDPKLACVQWRDVVSAWSRLSSAGHLSGAERVLVDDFLSYVEKHFDKLQPYNTVGACGGSEQRLLRRCRNILEALAPEQAGDHPGWGPCLNFDGAHAPAVKIGFFPRRTDSGTVLSISVALADTQGQAHRLFRDHTFADVERLLKAEWCAVSNFHCAFMQQNLFFPQRRVDDLRTYWAHWSENLGQLRQRQREEFTAFFSELVHLGIAAEDEKDAFDEYFANTNRSTLNVCPGIMVRYDIPLDRAAALDNHGKLAARVATEMRRVADIFRLPLAGGVK